MASVFEKFPELARSVSVAALAASLALGAAAGPMPGFSSVAWADDDGEAQGPQGPSDSGQGQGGQGAQAGQGNQGGGQGQGGPGPDSDGRGPQAGGPSDSSGGGQPPWASEGIPEIELGRLSVARSPDQVIDRAYAEALATIEANPEMADFYNMTTLLDFQDALANDWDEITILDSPLQNLALLRDALDGDLDLSGVGITNPDDDLLMAVFLGVASDKNVEITKDTAYAVSVIFEMPLTEQEAENLAENAEAIRIAVLAGHG